MSTLLKWAQNTQGKLTGSNKSSNGERKWIHPPEVLQKGHIAYLVKFLGNTVVEEAKGIEVVKEAIRKLRFSQQLRKSETGAKTKKVELTVSVDGVAIQEPRTHTILHQFPLHQISYCADDKGEKRFFSFIAKQQNPSESEPEDKHHCFVFISDKLAEEITLTIGQAFELAYKRFLETSSKDLETQQKAILVQHKVNKAEHEANAFKQRLLEISAIPTIRGEIDAYLRRNNLKSVLDLEGGQVPNIIDLNGSAVVPPVPPRNTDNVPSIGTKLEELLLHEHNDDDFDPRSFENNTTILPILAPPPKPAKRTNLSLNVEQEPVFQVSGSTPSSVTSLKVDPFEMGDFGTHLTSQQSMENDLGILEKRIMEMKAGFTRGISFGNEDFSLEDLDPLKN